MKKIVLMIVALTVFIVSFSCKNNSGEAKAESSPEAGNKASAVISNDEKSDQPLITFIELGSVNCIPCKKMQPIMKAIEKKYAGQVKVIFYDVWKPDQKKYAQEYGIRLIPTQVFLDKEGKEIFRHEGFFPESEIDMFVQNHGLKRESEG